MELTRHCSRCILLAMGAVLAHANPQPAPAPTSPAALKTLSLEALSALEVTTPSKEPQSAMRAPVAIYVITGEDIRRSGATCIPEALRNAPGVEVAQQVVDRNPRLRQPAL